MDGWKAVCVKLRSLHRLEQVSKFFNRPVLRTFFTYANWSNGFRGLVGGVPYRNRTDGISYGVQAETWW